MIDDERLRDAALAVKWMGYRWLTSYKTGERAIFHPDDRPLLAEWKPSDGTEQLDDDWTWTKDEWLLPHFHTDIAEAIGLAEAVCKQRKMWYQSISPFTEDPIAFYWFGFTPMGAWGGRPVIWENADTLPAAIVAAIGQLE